MIRAWLFKFQGYERGTMHAPKIAYDLLCRFIYLVHRLGFLIKRILSFSPLFGVARQDVGGKAGVDYAGVGVWSLPIGTTACVTTVFAIDMSTDRSSAFFVGTVAARLNRPRPCPAWTTAIGTLHARRLLHHFGPCLRVLCTCQQQAT